MAARVLPYAAIDARWEAQQLRAFRQLPAHSQQPAGAFAEFLLGRLLAEDLHVSCAPVLPPDVERLHGVTLQGLCVLQVRLSGSRTSSARRSLWDFARQIVDVANVGTSFTHRKEDMRGQTRTLKICFTDGHQLAFGFEFRWLPTFSTSLLHGTKARYVACP